MEEVDDYNPNGYGFSIGQDCLNVYLDYVKYAEDDYETAEKKNGGFYEEHRLAYFSIAGMSALKNGSMALKYANLSSGQLNSLKSPE